MLLSSLTFVSVSVSAGDMESRSFKPDVKWSVERGEITNVCNNYAISDWRYRSCRRAAQRKFGEMCSQYREQYRNSQGSTRDKAYKNSQTYCVSFRP
tara:strand:- start:5859 stop:6149 length:291 start_codon:yes stop_codon:yes gene_type:complete